MTDINEEKRHLLWKEIVQLESKEEDLLSVKRRYEKQLTDFYSDIQGLNHQINQLLEVSPGGQKTMDRIEEDNRMIQQAVGWYVDEELDELDKQTRKARRLLDDKREDLITERNQLSWE